MKFSIFPKRSADDRKQEIKDALWMTLIFGAQAITGFGLALYDFEHSFGEGSWLSTLSGIGLIVGFISLFCAAQSLIELVVAATIGPERFFAILLGGFALCAAMFGVGWLFQ